MNPKSTVKTLKWEEQVAKLWMVSGKVDDYFLRLGGSGRYEGFNHWHVPALLLLLISGLDPTKSDFLQSRESELISPRLWRESGDLVVDTKRDLSSLKMSPAAFNAYLNQVTKRLCDFNSESGQLLGWMRFITENSERFRSLTC